MDLSVSRKMIQELSDAFGASGYEDEVIQIARRYAEGLAERVEEDSLRNLFLYRKENTGEQPVVMLDAHSDEVSFMVQAIHPNGTLDFIPLGAWTPNTIPAHKVKILNREGQYISGIVASNPPHLTRKGDQSQNTAIEDMVIDVGAVSKEEVEQVFKIGVGSPAIPDVQWEYNEKNDVMLGKAFDCRIGCSVLLESLKELVGTKLDVDVVGVLTSQEEMGERGAMAAVGHVKPQLAIVLEGAPADDIFEAEYKIQSGLHRGPMMRCIDSSMIANPRLVRLVREIAAEAGIPLQEAARRGGGTDGGVIHTATGSVPTVVISVPVRYIHSHHCFTALDDFEKTVKLIVAILKKLNADIIGGF